MCLTNFFYSVTPQHKLLFLKSGDTPYAHIINEVQKKIAARDSSLIFDVLNLFEEI